jgi:hypothetical protein
MRSISAGSVVERNNSRWRWAEALISLCAFGRTNTIPWEFGFNGARRLRVHYSPMQCQLIKQAVAQYGYAASRRYALENYGPEAVRTGDKCLVKQTGRSAKYVPTALERR